MLISDLIDAAAAGALLAADQPQGWSGCELMMPSILIIAVLAYFMLLGPDRRDRQRREQLRKDLKKNDRVVTIGGVLGVVHSISPEGTEVTLKIDETTGAKVRVLRSAIHEVLRDDAKKDDTKKDDTKKDDAKKDEPKRDAKLEDTKKDEPKENGSAQ
jgi:preprotein translocase subunit YajC